MAETPQIPESPISLSGTMAQGGPRTDVTQNTLGASHPSRIPHEQNIEMADSPHHPSGPATEGRLSESSLKGSPSGLGSSSSPSGFGMSTDLRFAINTHTEQGKKKPSGPLSGAKASEVSLRLPGGVHEDRWDSADAEQS